MQTFLPYEDFNQSARVLDNKRLGKQRVAALQILSELVDKPTRWSNDPAVKMWRGYEKGLHFYTHIIMDEWKRRGFRNDLCWQKYLELKEKLPTAFPYPHWLGNEEFHRSHRSNLLRKNYLHYNQYFVEPTDLEYIWPVEMRNPALNNLQALTPLEAHLSAYPLPRNKQYDSY